MRERGKGKRLPESAYDGRARKPRVWSAAGKAVQRAKLDQARSPEQIRRAAAASGAKVREANAEKYAEIIRLYRAGGHARDIARSVDLNPATVIATLKRYGVTTEDLRRRALDDPDARKARTERLRGNVKAITATRERERRELAEEFRKAGATYQAVHDLAARHGVTPKSMADRLRKAGADVPDGRDAMNAKRRYGPNDVAEMRALYERGHSQAAIGELFGTNQANVSRLLRLAGVETRSFSRSSRLQPGVDQNGADNA